MATKIFDNDFAEKTQTPDPNDTLLIADHTQSGNPVRKMKMSTLFNPLQTEINSIVDNLKPYAERYEFQAVLSFTPPKDKSIISYTGTIHNGNNEVIVQNNRIINRYISDFEKNTSSIISANNSIVELFSNFVEEYRYNGDAESITVVGSCTKLYIGNVTGHYLDVGGSFNLITLETYNSNFVTLNLSSNPYLQFIGCYAMPELTRVDSYRVADWTLANFSGCPKLNYIGFDKTFDNLLQMQLQGTALSIDTIMLIGNAWTSRAGKDAGSITVSTSIFNSMTQDQKNVFINKNINILHQ